MQRSVRFLRALFLTVGMIALPAMAVAVCVAVVNGAISVNGIVVSTNVPAAPGTCQGDPGWAGVVAQSFVQITGTPQGDPAKQPTLFVAGRGSPVSTFYVGVHVPFDPDLRREDRLLLYLDADNSNTWNVGDFALLYEVGKLTPIVNQESCDSLPGQVQIYHHDGTSWGSPTLSPPGITSRFAFDYDDSGDPETNLWELEIAIDAGALGLSPGGFKVGAKLYPHEFAGSDTWTTWIWPSGLTAMGEPYLYFPGDDPLTPASMESISFAACADVIIDAISATDPNGNNNMFRPPASTDWVSGTLPANLRNSFSASVRFFNPSDPTDNSAVGAPNTGSVEFSIHPWGGGSFIGTGAVMRNEASSFTQLGQTRTISFEWPVTQAQYTPIQSAMQSSTHSCLTVRLNGFLVNLNPSTDYQNRNLTYTTLSTRLDTVVVSTRGPRFAEDSLPLELVLRAHWANLPAKYARGWGYRILNAANLGLRDAGDGYYWFRMPPGTDRKLALELTGGRMPPITTAQYALDPRAGGTVADPQDGLPPLRFAVKPGQMVTIVAQGRVRVDPDLPFNGANGRSDSSFASEQFLLRDSTLTPHQRIGAIIGSFDDFNRAFIVGADASVIVPQGASEMALAVNDVLGSYRDNTGDGFSLYVFIGEPHFLPTQVVSPGNPARGQPALADPAGDLPQLQLDVFQAVPVRSRPRQPAPADARRLLPLTYVAYAVYHTEEAGGGGGGGCAPGGPVGMGLFFGVSAVGLVLLRRRPKARRPRR